MEWLDYFISQSFDNGTSLHDVNSPQYQSFLWITTDIKETWRTSGVDPRSLAYLYHPLVPSYELLRFYAYGTLYYATNGTKWRNKYGWMDDDKTTGFCDWYGTFDTELCINQEGEQTELGANNLIGSLPMELALVTNMLQLDLRWNWLTGTIPDIYFDQWKIIRNLNLFHNRLTGSIPASIGKATDLSTVHFNENLLSSTLPTEIGNLHVLRDLHLSYNTNMSGSIPTEIGRLTLLANLGKYRYHHVCVCGCVCE